MKDQLSAIKRMLAIVLVGSSVVTAVSVGAAMQSQPDRATTVVATIGQARG